MTTRKEEGRGKKERKNARSPPKMLKAGI